MEINEKMGNYAEVVPRKPGEMAAALRTCDVLVNGTSVGMHPYEEDIPIDEKLLFKDLAVADIVYNPLMTRLLQSARKTGCRIVDGLGMLVYQGAEAFRLWTGVEPPVQEMFEAVRGAASDLD
jgi:shikimate dehydrogenase